MRKIDDSPGSMHIDRLRLFHLYGDLLVEFEWNHSDDLIATGERNTFPPRRRHLVRE